MEATWEEDKAGIPGERCPPGRTGPVLRGRAKEDWTWTPD